MLFRVAIVGAHVRRVAKVLELVKEKYDPVDTPWNVEFLPLVASFAFYEDENGMTVKYLSNVTYHGVDGKQNGSAIAQFYDNDDTNDTNRAEESYLPIAVVAIGVGIEDENDVRAIRTFFETLGGGLEGMVLECIQPNPEYDTMVEETSAFQKMSSEAKQEATEKQLIGPGKMAKFVLDLLAKQGTANINDADVEIVEDVETADSHAVTENENELPQEPVEEVTDAHDIDPSQRRYACRICREILFGEDDLQDPPHIPSRHQFSYRKQMAGLQQLESESIVCQSLFLGSGLPWMGNISDYEGKLGCPHCSSKLGIWKWAGTQCSCGTWVTPAIQIPRSKVDVLLPSPQEG